MVSLTLDESRRRSELIAVSSYDVALDLSGDDQTFTSTTVIRFVARASGETFLDVKPRQLLQATLDGRALDVTALRRDRLPLPLAEGEHKLVVEAVMSYRNDSEGIHRAVDPADGLHYTYANAFLDAAPSIFGCFDQPDLKAPFTLHVTTPTDWLVVGNSPAEQVEPGRWEFETTPPLATYFVTLVAGPYHRVTAEHDGITLGLESRRSLAEHLDKDAEEIFTITGQCFDEFHRLFGIRYPFGDYNQAFVPEFNAGAMENPGCVVLRDPLVFTGAVTRSERTNRATTIAHEMAHMWFGDLVTMRWWDDLWLNESFAEYMGTRVAHDATEFTDAWVDNGFVRRRWGIEADQRPSTHPVAGTGAKDARSALQDFDGICYAKGSAVLKQLNATLGDDVFFGGVRDHFIRHRFGNASMRDLFESWRIAGAGDVDGWAADWLRTAGPDLLRLDRAADGGGIRLSNPPGHPADRRHATAVAHHDEDGWVVSPVTVQGASTPVPGLGDRPVLLDPAEETWARVMLDDVTLSRLPDLLPSMPDPVMRSTVWNAVRDSVFNALLDPDAALRLVEVALPHEDQDVAIKTLAAFGLGRLADRLCTDRRAARMRVHSAALARLASAEPQSDVQLAAMRASIDSSENIDLLRSWVRGEDVPNGVTVDLELRWQMLIRLACLDGVTRPELEAWLARETTTQAKVHLIRCLSSLPDEAAKQYAWERFTGAVPATPYEIEAAGLGLWQPGQEQVTDPYLDRYFAEVAGTVELRSGWMLAEAARLFFPWTAVRRSTLDASERVLDDQTLDPSLRRTLVDRTDDLRRDVVARERYG